MKNFISKLKKYIPSKRKIIQLYSALLFNVNFKGFLTGNIYQGNTKKMCVPGLNCYSCPGAVGACPLGSLQGAISADRSTLYYMCGILVIFGVMLGRMICGWLCPFGLIQELLYKIKTPKLKKNKVTRLLSYFKYVVLVFFVFIVPIMYAFRDTPLPAFCKYICPAGTLEGGIGLLSNKANASYFSMLGPLFTWKFLILISVVVTSIFIFRMFCRFICPLGALYGFFNKISFFGIKVDNSKCTNCSLCISKCKMDIKKVGDHECISCGECISVCPTKAISFKGSGLFRKNGSLENGDTSHKKAKFITRCISTIILLGIFIAAIIFYWNDEKPSTSSGSSTTTENQGNEVGDICYGADLQLVNGEGILKETINPVTSGKITIINFWGTWCTPCVNELPYFDQIATNYKDNVNVIAIHTNMINDTAPGYIGEHYKDSNLIFATDLANEEYYTLLGGRGTYPYTVIIDENGKILKIFVTAVHYEDLEEVVKEELDN